MANKIFYNEDQPLKTTDSPEFVDATISGKSVAETQRYLENHKAPSVRQTVLSGSDRMVKAGNSALDATGDHNRTVLYNGSNLKQKIATGLNMGDGYDAEWSTTPFSGAIGDEYLLPLDPWDGGLGWHKARLGLDKNNLVYTSLYPSSSYLVTDLANSLGSLTELTVDFEDGYNNIPYTQNNLNVSGDSFVSWLFRTTHRIKGLTSAGKPYWTHYNPTTGFFITVYEGDGVAGHAIPHPMGEAPKMVISKSLDRVGSLWCTYVEPLGNTEILFLNENFPTTTSSGYFSSIPSTTSVNISTGLDINASGNTYLMIGFCTGATFNNYFDVGSFSSVVGETPEIPTTARPDFLLTKPTTVATSWGIVDKKRIGGYSVNKTDDGHLLYPDLTVIEGGVGGSSFTSEITETGFKLKAVSSINYIYLAAKMDSFTDLTIDGSDKPAVLTFAEGYDSEGNALDHNYSHQEESVTIPLTSDATNYIYADLDTVTDPDNPSVSFGATLERPEYDENAVANAITPHTSNTSESGTSSGSSQFSTGVHPYWQAFDGISSSYWLTDGSAFNITTGYGDEYLQYDFNVPRRLESFFVKCYATISAHNIIDYEVWASNDGFISHDVVYSVVGSTPILEGTTFESYIKDTSYTSVRLRITRIQIGYTYPYIEEFKILSPDVTNFHTKDYLMKSQDGTTIKRLYLGEVDVDDQGDITYVLQYPKGDTWESDVYDVVVNTLYSVENPFRVLQSSLNVKYLGDTETNEQEMTLYNNGTFIYGGESQKSKDTLFLRTGLDNVYPYYYDNTGASRAKDRIKFKLRRDF